MTGPQKQAQSPLPPTLIFDLGNVIIPLKDETHWAQHVFNPIFEQEPLEILRAGGFFRYYEMGKFGDKEFLDKLETHLRAGYHRKDIIDAWIALLDELPMHRLDFLLRLSENHRILLLSNTNNIHLSYIFGRYGQEVLEKAFSYCYYSHLIGLAKPDSMIYKYLLAKEQLQAEDTLFLDDKADNIRSASELGIQTILVTPGEEIEALLAT
jgi:glucose-1-phosphatase